MYKKIFLTNDHWSSLVARVTLGMIIFPHGAQKLFGWFGGYGFNGTMGFFTASLGIPYVFALLAILAEALGAFALIFGLATRVAALGIGVTMAVAAQVTYTQNGAFFMNWFGNQAGEGIEYHLLALGIAATLVIGGGGKLSIDRMLTK